MRENVIRIQDVSLVKSTFTIEILHGHKCKYSSTKEFANIIIHLIELDTKGKNVRTKIFMH